MRALRYALIVFAVVVLASLAYLIYSRINKSKTQTAIENSPTPVNNLGANSAENAENLAFIKSALVRENINPSWINSNCVYAVTSTEEDFQTVEIRERHTGEGCEVGDPSVSPRIDGFKLKDSIIEWFEFVSGDYVSLDDYRQCLNSLP